MLRTIKFILNHPFTKGHKLQAILGFVKWQITSRITKRPAVYQFTKNSKLWVWKGLTGATGNIYCGLHEFEDMAFLLHFLRPGDWFTDVGANIGSYTILASGEAGANSIAVEPVPATFSNLQHNINLNELAIKVKALNIGLGSKKDILRFTKGHDTGNHVANDNDTDIIEVPIDTLDNIMTDNAPILIKIDVEGFETEVLNGAKKTLASAKLKAIIIELNGAGRRYGFEDAKIHTMLLDHGFKPMRYLPFKRRLETGSLNTEHNTLYIRDLAFVEKRLITAKTVYIKHRPL
ncbi:FkbM family methyltransferase [Mucilaginibacter pallidiroseus]|uniref:FkbM family methyltransferase n=1 Tax=Mucilaginibacter pallidiroseus TaxID=2599295 RepID=A0A563UFW2_9SPHI|nr:FkbM family methyltransferase [Mucilaginibacter pallidiroseus]TWR30237.1 FkbM family methyltransferase [Mucilaginibacter pallidiroseus]